MPNKKAPKQIVTLAQAHALSEEAVLGVLKKSFNHHSTNRSTKHEPTLELARDIVGRLRDFQDTLYPIFEQFGRYPGLVVLDHGKKSTTALEIKIPDKVRGKVFKKRIRERSGTTDILEIAKRLMDKRNGNLGLELGDVGDGARYLLCIEVDIKDRERQQLLLSRLGKETFLVRSPSRKGLHVFFWTNNPIGNPKKWRIGGAEIDIKGVGGYVVSPGTNFQDKGVYACDVENEWFSLSLAELPDEWEAILDEFLPPSARATKGKASLKSENRKQTHRVELLSGETAMYAKAPSALVRELESMSAARLYEYAMAGKIVPRGYRFRFCGRVAGHLEGHLHWEEIQVFERLCGFRESVFEDSDAFQDNEIERAVSWAFRDKGTHRAHRVELVSPREHSSWNQFKTELSWCEQEFVRLLSVSKEADPGVSLAEIAEIYRQYAQIKTRRLFAKPIPGVVGRVLRIAGFTKKIVNSRTPEGKRTKVNLWKVDLSLVREELRSLESKPRNVSEELHLLREKFSSAKWVGDATLPASLGPSNASVEPANDAVAALVPGEPRPALEEAYTKVSDLGEKVAKSKETLKEARERLLRSMIRSSEELERERMWREELDQVSAEDAERSRLDIERQWAALCG